MVVRQLAVGMHVVQGGAGDCVANATASAFGYARSRNGCGPMFEPSRLFIYYNQRCITNTVATDSGGTIKDAVAVVCELGAPPEESWPYELPVSAPGRGGRWPERSKSVTKPPADVYSEAAKYAVTEAKQLSHDLHTLRACLADGWPFVFGFETYAEFRSSETERTGILRMPRYGAAAVGAHAGLAIGYDDDSRQFIIQNWEGPSWGEGGCFRMPYEYILTPGMAFDFWVILRTRG